ncbi:MAG: HAD-IIB family hydrolase [Synechococcales bacterium]|nr:HAD-IIB family hydrolase [Synechococcales bacterium]
MLLIFTDLDGTLLNQDDYRYDPVLPVLKQMQQRGVPVVPVTSKTRREVASLREALQLKDPFITENGSGVFVDPDDHRFALDDAETWEGYRLLRLGCTYAEARQGLQTVADKLGEPLRGFGDLSVAEVQERTGLSAEEAALAKLRDFTEPFVTPAHVPAEQIQAATAAAGFRVTVGDRFSHLISPQAGKGRAALRLLHAYQTSFPEATITTIGLGNSPNDLDMLEVVDQPIVVPGKRGPHPQLAERGWPIAPAPGSQGWAEAVQDLGDRLLANR